jgi:phage-related protein
VRAEGDGQSFRVLFAQEGRGPVVLALEALSKTTQRTPPETIRLAERRRADCRARAQKGDQTR